jgi:hypothetical protein
MRALSIVGVAFLLAGSCMSVMPGSAQAQYHPTPDLK